MKGVKNNTKTNKQSANEKSKISNKIEQKFHQLNGQQFENQNGHRLYDDEQKPEVDPQLNISQYDEEVQQSPKKKVKTIPIEDYMNKLSLFTSDSQEKFQEEPSNAQQYEQSEDYCCIVQQWRDKE
ncbi:unnamed protein product [Paramecium octaurelia]|uniref:Uncharacterized protein n=1 Tax=Paramecium octaurelia TaxID=43137 RepID=A0A8S1SII9_PAROT|nr:unnamed protein product [Paramecium octaurelia]